MLLELYEKFFSNALKKDAVRLGIVYTPVEVVDFILHSADEVLREEFGRSLSDEGVHLLDPFAGAGVFPLPSTSIRPYPRLAMLSESTGRNCTLTRLCCSRTTSRQSISRRRTVDDAERIVTMNLSAVSS